MVLGALIFVALQIFAVSGRECFPQEEKVYVFPKSSSTYVSWTEALAMCGRDGMSLATIKTKQEFKGFMYRLSKDGVAAKPYWLGASCEGRCGRLKKGWYWITDHSRMDRTRLVAENWNASLPNGYSGPAMYVSNGRWQHGYYNTMTGLWVCQACRPKFNYDPARPNYSH